VEHQYPHRGRTPPKKGVEVTTVFEKPGIANLNGRRLSACAWMHGLGAGTWALSSSGFAHSHSASQFLRHLPSHWNSDILPPHSGQTRQGVWLRAWRKLLAQMDERRLFDWEEADLLRNSRPVAT
jgi:hypothetical protein